MIGLYFAAVSSSDAYQVTICARVENGFGHRHMGDDWTGTGDLKLRGVYMTVTKWSSSSGGTLLGVPFADYIDDVDGCEVVSLATGWYDVDIRSLAEVNGVPVGSYYTEDYSDWGEYSIPGRHQVTSVETIYVRPEFSRLWAALLVGTRAMHMNNAGLGSSDGLHYNVEFGNCCNGSNYEMIRADTTSKSTLGHETGHRVGRIRDGNNPPERDWGAPGDVACDATEEDNGGGQDFSLASEYQSASVAEGWADFYAAWLFNNEEESCTMAVKVAPMDTDFDGDEDFDGSSGAKTYSCEGKPTSGTASWIDEEDWLADLVAHTGGGETCNISLVGVGTPYDVERYFWDMYTDQNVPMGHLVDIYDAADPQDWALTYDLFDTSRNPFRRLDAAATAHSDGNGGDWGGEHDIESSNGVNHGP